MSKQQIIECDKYGVPQRIKCWHCGKTVTQPVYAPAHEETTRPEPYHQRCLDKLARNWERNNP